MALCWDMIGLTETTRDSTRDHDPPLAHPSTIQDLPPFRQLPGLGVPLAAGRLRDSLPCRRSRPRKWPPRRSSQPPRAARSTRAFSSPAKYVHLTDLIITQTCRLVGRTVREVQADNRVNIVMHQGPGGVNANPSGDTVLAPGDTILVIAPMEPLLELEALNQPAHDALAGGPGKTQQPSGR